MNVRDEDRGDPCRNLESGVIDRAAGRGTSPGPAVRRRSAPAAVVATALAACVAFGCAGGSSGGGGSGGSATASGGSAAGLDGSGGAAPSTGGAGAGTGGASASGGAGGAPLALPVAVTDYYTNQGWFGDANVMTYFTPGATIISQASSAAGPCATRQPGARGQCLQIVYTPPAALTAPAGGGAFVGVFFLTTLAMAHPEAIPPMRAGDPNWGDEPGKSIAPGASSISFWAASTTPGLVVTFKAGTANDAFSLPETPQTLTQTWTRGSLAIAGYNYGTSVAGAFAWILKDTTHAATFYLDGIVWE